MNKTIFLCLLIIMFLLKINLFLAESSQCQNEIVNSVFSKETLLSIETLSGKENNIEIPKINSIRNLLNILREGDLLLLDIDDTILRSGKIKYICPAMLIEENLVETIKNLRDRGVVILFLTSRNPIFSEITEKQLMDLGINVFDFMEFKEIRNLNETGLFRAGIIYAPNQEKKCMKGEVFKSFFQKKLFEKNASECKLKNVQRIFLVDDLKGNIQQFLSVFCDVHLYKNISFKGYVFEYPKSINLKTLKAQEYPNIFEVCNNLFILAISVFKKFFSFFSV